MLHNRWLSQMIIQVVDFKVRGAQKYNNAATERGQ